jgi:hypothetical protein
MNSDDKTYRVRVPAGTYLADSKDTAGNKRALLFDSETNKLVGPPEMLLVTDVDDEDGDYVYSYSPEPEKVPLTDEEIEEILETVGAILVGVVKIAVALHREASPHINHWWLITALPALRRLRDKAMGKTSSRPPLDVSDVQAADLMVEDPDLADLSKEAPVEFSAIVDAAFEQYKSRMGPEEVRQRYIAVRLAEAFIAEQKLILSNARVENYDHYEELICAAQQLTAHRAPMPITLALTALVSQTEVAEVEMDDGEKIIEVHRVPFKYLSGEKL